jgi:transcription antitermination factor NusG
MAEEMYHSTINSKTTLNWYALHIRSRHEKRVAERIVSQSMETFLPLHRCRQVWKNGVRAEVDFPLFPCYLFARIFPNDRLRLLQLPGVLGFVSSSGRPTIIPDEEVLTLRAATEIFRVEPHPYLNSGDEIRIVAGPLAGIKGILIRRKNEYRVLLSIEAIMRSIVVEVSEFDIEPQEKSGNRFSEVNRAGTGRLTK